MSRGGLYSVDLAAKTDVLKNASALITQRLFRKEPINDRVWIVTTALTIIGFVTYQLLINSWLRTENFVDGSAKLALDDILKFSTMFIVRQALSGQSITDPEFVKSMGIFVGALALYDITLANLVNDQAEKFDNKSVTLAINDVAKFGIVFTLVNFAEGKEFDEQWMMGTGGFLTGLVIYDVVLAKYTEGKF
jgi:hypothetical protein